MKRVACLGPPGIVALAATWTLAWPTFGAVELDSAGMATVRGGCPASPVTYRPCDRNGWEPCIVAAEDCLPCSF